MILCTFNTKDKSITLTSFMRDLYVNIPGAGMNKLNAAYPMGGYTLLGETLLENFGVKVDHYVEVDFSGFKKAVNILGGIDMYLTAAEAEYMNTTPWDGLNSEGWALHAGVNHLNGDMALAYSRIRAIGYDYERTERQRKVLTAMIDKCKGMNIGTAMNLMNQLLGCVRTDMTDAEITRYALELFPLLSGNLTQQRIPIEGSYEDNHNVIIPDYDMNHQFLVDTLMPD
jgi:LCP family protein required for cell wall assembly